MEFSAKTPSKMGGRARGELIKVDDEEQDHSYSLYTWGPVSSPSKHKGVNKTS